MKQTILLASLAFLIGSCTNQESFEPTEEEQHLMKAYAALLFHGDRFGKTQNPDSLTLYRDQTDSLLSAYGYTRDSFTSAFEDLVSNPERLEPLLRSISADFAGQSGR
ncbi:MAG: hypothetical protein WEB33_10585 [Bacteroidota bacterium]